MTSKNISIDAHILSALRGAPWGVSGGELSRKLSVSRAAILLQSYLDSLSR